MKCHVCLSAYSELGPHIYQCDSCRHVYRTPPVNPLEYHKEGYRKDPKNRRVKGEFDAHGRPTKAFHRARQKIVRDRIKIIKHYLSRKDSCLDVGAGGGTFALAVYPHVAGVDCLEVDPHLAAECRKEFQTYESDIISPKTNGLTYDVIFMWHVLEHLQQPAAALHKISRMAQRMAFVEIPFGRPIPQRYDGHCHYFSSQSFEKILSPFNIVEIREGVQKPARLAILEVK